MVLAHSGIGAGSLGEVLTAWSWDPLVLIGLTVLVVLYAVGLSRTRRRSLHLFPWWRPFFFYLGIAFLALALLSPIDALSDHFFFMHMVQHMLLTMMGPPLVLLGAPVIPILRGLPRPFRRRVVVPVVRSKAIRRLLHALTTARVAFLVYFGGLWVWHFPLLYELAVRSELVHILEHSIFVLGATLFWWVVIDPVPFHSRIGSSVKMVYLFFAATPNALLGAFLTYSPGLWYPFYAGQALQVWNLTAAEDQKLAGIIMWLPSWMMFLFAISVVFFLMMAEEERSLRERESQYRSQTAKSVG